jgi:hypothetical protein
VRQLGDLVRFNRRPPGGGAAQTLNCRIVAIAHTVTPDNWLVTFQTSRFTDAYWVLGDSTYGVLDSTTVAGF